MVPEIQIYSHLSSFWVEDSTNTLADREGNLGQHTHCVYEKHPTNIHLSLLKEN